MDKQLLFRKSALVGTIVSLGLSGCAQFGKTDNVTESQAETSYYEERVQSISDGPTVLFTQEEVVCDVADANCAPAENYLTGQEFVTEEISASRPAARAAVAVKGKPAAPKEKPESVSVDKETVFYATTPVEEGEKVAEPVVIDVSETVVETPNQSEEQVLEEQSEEVVTALGGATVETLTETRVQVEPGEAPVAEVEPAGVIPLKKVRTTITETTTRYQKEFGSDPLSEALIDRIAYGEGVHDWEANAGSTLRKLLLDWGVKSGWTVVWKLDRDYHLEAGVIFRGTFTDVSGALIRSFARATPAPIGT